MLVKSSEYWTKTWSNGEEKKWEYILCLASLYKKGEDWKN